MAKEKPTITTHTTTRQLTYDKGGFTISFSVVVDNSSQLRKLQAVLEVAIEDIKKQIEGMKN